MPLPLSLATRPTYADLDLDPRRFSPRDAMQARPMSSCGVRVRHAVSVCLSVRCQFSYILSKRINISSIFLPVVNHTIRLVKAIIVRINQKVTTESDAPP